MSTNLHRILVYIVLLAAIVLRSDYEIRFADYSNDKAFQIFAAKGIDQGEGYHLPYVDPDDLSQDRPDEFKGYPPLYSYSIALFTPSISYFHASQLLDVLAIVVLFSGIFLIVLKLGFNWWQQIIVLAFLAISPYPFAEFASTDLIVAALFSWMLYLLLRSVQVDQQKPFDRYVLLIALLGTICVGFKYSAYPLMVIPALTYVLIGLSTKIRALIYKGTLTLLLAVVFLVLLKLWLPDQPKDKVFESGFYPGNLLQLDDFVFKSFFYVQDLVSQLGKTSIQLLVRIAGLFMTGITLFVLLVSGFRIFRKGQFSPTQVYILITGLSTFIILAFLTLLSLRTHPEMWKDPPWTYVEESRYYGPAIISIQILLFVVLFRIKLRKKLKLLLLIFLGGSFGFNFLYWAKQNKNVYFSNEALYTYSWDYAEQLSIAETLDHLDSNKLIYSDCSPFNEVFIGVNTRVRILPFKELNTLNSSSHNDPLIIIHCSDQDFRNLFNNPLITPQKELFTSKGQRLYVVSLSARQDGR